MKDLKTDNMPYADKEIYKQYHKEYYQKNKDSILLHCKEKYKEKIKNKPIKEKPLHHFNFKHGHTTQNSKTYLCWLNVIRRCRDVKDKSYKNYGGRGIKVCERWYNFLNFLEDMGEKPNGLQIDRINNNGDYEPSNCRWVTKRENARNKRDNVWVIIIFPNGYEEYDLAINLFEKYNIPMTSYSNLKRALKFGYKINGYRFIYKNK